MDKSVKILAVCILAGCQGAQKTNTLDDFSLGQSSAVEAIDKNDVEGQKVAHSFRKTPIWHNEPIFGLPDQTIFSLEEFDEAQKLVGKNQVLTWDFNQDGHTDMLEIRDSQGKTLAQYFNFHFDGKIDEIRFAE